MTQILSEEDLRLLIEIRTVEEQLLDLFSHGKVRGTLHTCIGQEAVAVGVIKCLDLKKDTIFSNHRGHGHFLAATRNTKGLLAELMGKKGAVCGGMGGTQHLHSKNYFGTGIQGAVPGLATGLALAHKLNREGSVSVAFLGDGTFGEGITYEALNMASLWKLPILYVVEDNNIAQSTPSQLNRAGSLLKRFEGFNIRVWEENGQDIERVIAAASEALKYIRAGHGPHGIIFKTHRFAPHSKGDDTRPLEVIRDLWKEDPIHIISLKNDSWKMWIESLRQEISNEIKGVIKDLERAPFVDLCAESDNIKKEIPRDEGNFEFQGTVGNCLNSALRKLLEKNPKVVLLGEDLIDPYGGAFKITKGLSTDFKNRVFTTPISEAGIVAIANGLALSHFSPIVEIMFGDFLFLAADQIINHAAKFRLMYGKDLPFSLVIRTPMGGRRGYGPTHSQSIEKYFFGNSGLWIVAINHLADPGYLLELSLERKKGPVLFLENKLLYNRNAPSIDRHLKENIFYESSGARIIQIFPKSGTIDGVLIGYGGMAPYLLDAAEELQKLDIFIELLIPEQISPVGEKFLDLICESAHPLLVVEESSIHFGWGAEIIARLSERGIRFPLRRLGALDDCIPSAIHLEEKILPQTDQIVHSVLKMVHSI